MRFLITRLSSLGDVIHSLPLVSALRENFPSSQIDWIVGDKGFELLKLIREIDNIFLFDRKNLFKNIYSLWRNKYDYAIDVQGLLKSAFISRFSLAKSVVGFKATREFADLFYDKKVFVGNLFNTKKHVVDLNLELLKAIKDFELRKVKFLIPKIQSLENSLLGSEVIKAPYVILFPSTTWESKLWIKDYWFELTKLLSVKTQVLLCGAKSDLSYLKDLTLRLESQNVSYINLIGKTSITNLIYLIQNSKLVVGLDSAPLHLASAIKNDFGYPDVIGIYGPTSICRNGPYNLSNNVIWNSKLDCISCRKKRCPLGHHKCMIDVLPERVYEEACRHISSQ